MPDMRFVFRALARTPGFTATVILALAVGIGATTAIFSLVNGVLLRPLPYQSPERLVMVWQDFTARGGPADEWASPGNVRDWQQQRDVFSSLAALTGWSAALSLDGQQAEAVSGEQVTWRYFSTLGIAPQLGRDFREADDVPGAARVVILGDELWQSRFGGDRSVLGRSIVLAGEPHQVIGVAPRGTSGVLDAEAQMWRPRRLNLAEATYNSIFLRVVARLADGVTLEAAQARVKVIARALEAQHPDLRQQGINVQEAHDWIVGDSRLPLAVLMAAVLALLALTVANIANLLLARASAREREMSIRAAIGASRGRLMRLLLLESVTLSLAGGVLGTIFASWALDGLVGLVSDVLPRAAEVSLDRQVLLFTAALAALTGLLFGLAPAAQSSRPDLQSPLRDSVRVGSPRGQRARKALVVAQVALALVMLVSATLIVRSFSGLRQADLGFEPDGVATGRVALAGGGYRTRSEVLGFLEQLEERLPAVPGVASAAFTSVLPLAPGGDSDMDFLIAGKPELEANGRPRGSWYRSVSAGYFATMGMRMARGRAMAPNAAEAVVNEAFARRFWPNENAIGGQIVLERNGPPLTVVGIVADAKTRGPRSETRNEMFLPYQFLPEGGYSIVLRAKAGIEPSSLVPSLRALLASIDRRLPLSAPATLQELHAEALAQPRLLATLLGAFAVSALFLSLLGIYGVVAYAVGHRTTEIGVRLALGATPRQVVGLVVGDGVKLGLTGLVLGVAGGLAVTATLGTLLYGVAPHDPVTYVVAAVVIFGTAALGSWLPARRASRIPPTEALRG